MASPLRRTAMLSCRASSPRPWRACSARNNCQRDSQRLIGLPWCPDEIRTVQGECIQSAPCGCAFQLDGCSFNKKTIDESSGIVLCKRRALCHLRSDEKHCALHPKTCSV